MPSSKKSRPIATFRHSLAVDVFEPEFKLSPSLRFMNVERWLKRQARRSPSARWTAGAASTPCTPRFARAWW